eukprot:5221108-Lingulodinium_polyedra.AAC.1
MPGAPRGRVSASARPLLSSPAPPVGRRPERQDGAARRSWKRGREWKAARRRGDERGASPD